MPKISRPILYTAILAVGAVAWVMTGEETPTSGTKKSVKRATSATKDKLGFTEDDYKKHNFEPVAVIGVTKFQPLVSRTQTASSLALAPDAVPAELAGGDPNWVYTGTAEIDGKPTALLENKVTLESEFVSQGQKWKRSEIAQILPQGLVLAGPSGRKVKLALNNGDATVTAGAERFASGFRPVNPALSGPIGANGVAVRPDRNNGQRNAMEARDAN